MAKPYRYVGHDARDYPTLGFSVTPGDIAYLEGRPPDDRFVEVEVVASAAEDATGEQAVHGDEDAGADWRNPTQDPPAEDLKQPNKAASQAEWTEFAEAHGGFEQATGTAPADATRKAIVDHYTAEPAVPSDVASSVADNDDDASKEV